MFRDILNHEYLAQYRIVDFGIVEGPRPVSYDRYRSWLAAGQSKPLTYLEDHRSHLREDLRRIFPPFQSGIVFLFSYSEYKFGLDEFYKSKDSNGKKMASYVFACGGEDYHLKLNSSLSEIAQSLKEAMPEMETMISLDIHPVLERDLAYRAGLGWFGKNSMLISKKHGSFCMIGSILTSCPPAIWESDVRKMEVDHCGQCVSCVESCPTQAINIEARTIIASQCISTYTIEIFKQAEAPRGMSDRTAEVFGCDICQDVCPWNKRLLRVKNIKKDPFGSEYALLIKNFFLDRRATEIVADLKVMSNREFKRKFQFTALERTGKMGILKNFIHAKFKE